MSQQQANYEKYSEAWKGLQETTQDFVRLNTDTIKSFQAQSIKPEDFSKVTRPDELLEKQMQMALNYGEKAIDYMQQSLQIIGKAMHSFAEECKSHSKK